MPEETQGDPSSHDLIAGYKEWASVSYPLAPGWNSGTDLLLRQAWMTATRAERARWGAAKRATAPSMESLFWFNALLCALNVVFGIAFVSPMNFWIALGSGVACAFLWSLEQIGGWLADRRPVGPN